MTSLTDRMRTCAAHLCTIDALEINEAKYEAIIDAAALLIEASNALEAAPAPQGEPSIEDRPMEAIPPVVQRSPASEESMRGTWIVAGDTLPVARPYRSLQACPQCDSRANKKAYRQGKSLVLECPVCGHAWKRA